MLRSCFAASERGGIPSDFIIIIVPIITIIIIIRFKSQRG